MRIHYFGHSAVGLENEGTFVLIDPFISDNPLMQGKELPKDLKVSRIFLTHGHSDHTGDCEELSKKFDAPITAVFELASIFSQKGCKTTPCGIGGKISYDWGWSRFVPAFHSSSCDGQYAGAAAGVLVNIGDVTLYHAGDTGVFGDMRLINELYLPEVAFLPIGGIFTMDIYEAAKATKMIQPEIVIPIHYNTMPAFNVNLDDFVSEVKLSCSSEVKILEPGTSWELDLG